MFGQDDNQQQQPSTPAPLSDAQVLNAAMPDPITIMPPSAPDFGAPAAAPAPTAPVADLDTPELPAIGTPDLPSSLTPDPITSVTDDSIPTTDAPDDLVDIKQQALQHLSPLVGHLDQTPEEKFRTTMMMIQASDNKDLIKDAFEAAQKITEDKARAQALLDVINEINYFTTQHEN